MTAATWGRGPRAAPRRDVRIPGDVLGSSLGAMRAVHLDELTDLADLQRRVDRKHVLPLQDCAPILDALLDDAQVLEIDGTRAFAYTSVYFDTPDLTCYLLAARRRPRRFKIRTRTYVDSAQCWLEVKTRDRRGWTIKDRAAYDVRDQARLTPDGRRFVQEVLAGAGVTLASTVPLRPTLVTSYRRSTLYLPSTGSRLTVDTDLTCAQPDGSEVSLPWQAVVETKTNGKASLADRLLWAGGHRPVQISKYGTGLAALRPELPATKWHPVLSARPFLAPHPVGTSGVASSS